MCDVQDPRILNAYIAITEDEPLDWLILGYNDTKDVISLYSCGENGLSEFRDNIIANEILYGFIRIEEKFVLINFIPDNISGVRRARALVHSRAVAGILEISHAQMTASSLNDLSDSNMRTRLKLDPGRPKSRSSFIQQQQRRRRSCASYYSPSPSPVIFADDDEDTLSERTTPTPTPSTPTFNEPASSPFYVMEYNDEPKRIQDNTDSMLQQHLLKKKELEESRFKLFQKEQPKIMKRIEEEQKRIKQQKEKVVPQWQIELQQRKLQKKQQQQEHEIRKIQSYQQIPTSRQQQIPRPKSLNFDQPAPKQMVEMPKIEETESRLLRPKKSFTEPLLPSKPNEPAEASPSHSKAVVAEKLPKIVEHTSQVAVMTGFVSVQINSNPFWKRRYYIVNEAGILLYKDETSKQSLYDIQYKDTLRISLIDEDEDVFVPNSFIMETKKEIYQLLADDKKEFKALYTILKKYH